MNDCSQSQLAEWEATVNLKNAIFSEDKNNRDDAEWLYKNANY